MADRGREPGIGDQRRRVGDLGRALAPSASARLCRVPPEMMSPSPIRPAGCWVVTIGVGFDQLLAPALARGLGGEQHAEVGRQRLEPADLDDLDAGLRRALVEGVDRPSHERDLAGQVDVVGAVLDAGFDHRRAVEGVGADQVEDDPGPCGHRRQRGGVADVGQDRLRRRAADLAEDALELADVAPRHGPAEVPVFSPTGEVGGDAAAGDATGAEDDDR